jgi:tetratricopeptide (TPR) repeat protein
MEGLDSLRNAVEHMDDLAQIIDRYQRFISSNTDPQALAGANKDLQIWKERHEAGLVKLGTHWVTPAQREQLRRQSQSEVVSVCDFLKQNRTEEAELLLNQALDDDPGNATAIFIRGVELYHRNQLADARDAFNSANAMVPNDAPVLNNLAVIAWQLGVPQAATGFYDQAMRASPVAPPILDNVAEALAALSPQDLASPLAQQMANDFRRQDALLQARRAKDGLFRWGSGWVTAEQLTKFTAEAGNFTHQLVDVEDQIEAVQKRIGDIDSEAGKNTRIMHRMEANAANTQPLGIAIQMQMPDSYYQLSDDNQKLAQDKTVLQSQQDTLRAQMKQTQDQQRNSASRKFTGQQHIFGVEAAPQSTAPSANP